MTDENDGTALSTAEAAEHLRRLRDTLGPDQLREAFETGGGLMEHEENRLREALDVLGTRRTAEILDIEVPDSGLPGEQVTIGGEPVSGRVPEERAEPVPDDTASLSEFDRDDEEDEDEELPEGTIRLPIDAVKTAGASIGFRPPTETVSIDVAKQIEEAILEHIDPQRFDFGDRAGWALVTEDPVVTERELVSVGRTLAEAARRAEDIDIETDETVTFTTRDPETGETMTLEAPEAVNGWVLDRDPPPGRGTIVWNDPTVQDADRFVFIEKTGRVAWLAGLRRRTEPGEPPSEQVDVSAGSGEEALQGAIELMEENEVDEGAEPDCPARKAAIVGLLNSARRQGILDFNEFDQAITAAERDGCVASADATRLRDTAQTAAPEPSDREFDQLIENLQLAIDVDEGGEVAGARAGGVTKAPELTEAEAVDVVQRALDIEGPDAIAAFLDPDEIAPLGQATSFQLSGAVETLGEDRVREVAGLKEGDPGNG